MLVGCNPAAEVKNTDNPDGGTQIAATTSGRLVIAFGDSLYAGYQLAPQEGFVPQLQKALRGQGLAVSVLNAGVSGDTTAAGRARLNFLLDNTPQKVDLVILGLGGNDMLRGVDPEEVRGNLSAMIAELKKRKIGIMLTGIVAAPNLGGDYAAKFNPIYSGLAREHGLPLYPFLLDGVITHRELMLADGIHPNSAGAAEVARRVAPVVAAALKQHGG